MPQFAGTPLCSHPLAAGHLLSVATDLPVLGIAYGWNHTAVFCIWLLSFSVVFSRFTFGAACVSTSFSLMASYVSIHWLIHTWVVSTSCDTAVCIHAQVLLQTHLFSPLG